MSVQKVLVFLREGRSSLLVEVRPDGVIRVAKKADPKRPKKKDPRGRCKGQGERDDSSADRSPREQNPGGRR